MVYIRKPKFQQDLIWSVECGRSYSSVWAEYENLDNQLYYRLAIRLIVKSSETQE